MTKEDDPYLSLLQIMEETGAALQVAPFYIGTIVSSNPVIVKVEDIQIERKNLKINRALLPGYSRRLSMASAAATGSTAGESGGSGESSFSNHSHGHGTIGIPGSTFTTLDTFIPGEEVLLVRSKDGQQYVLICRLV